MSATQGRPQWRATAIMAVVAIVALAGALRFWNLRDLPAGFYCDEAANGYNAYSLLQTGRDENGMRWPLFVWSFGQAHKNPLYIYSTMASVAVLGLDEFSTRVPAAFYGTLTVAAVAVLGAQLFGLSAGVAAALVLALQPWHLHFSRIAFELICFPCVFVLAVVCARAGLNGRRWAWHAAAALFAACSYSYAPAKMFVPLFLAWLAFVYPPARQQARGAAVLYLVLNLPWIIFDLWYASDAVVRLQSTGITRISDNPLELAWIYLWYYISFLTPEFLFQAGDPIVRHAVRGFGELSLVSAPFVVLGIVACARHGRDGLLVLGWVLLYPLTGALQMEVPSASHGIIGAPAFALLAGAGVWQLLAWAGTISRPWRRAVSGALAVMVGLLALETTHYWRAYRDDYPIYAAASWEGFQYGYRDVIAYMEQAREGYDELFLTRAESNQPYIFPLFYRPLDPAMWQQTATTGYELFDPATGNYPRRKRALLALRPDELALFGNPIVEHTVVAPGGQTEFVIVSVSQ